MKVILRQMVSVAAIAYGSTLLNAQTAINFRQSPLADLLSLAKKEKKLLFIDAMASWCGPCKMMDKNVFSDASVGQYFNKNFISGKFDMEVGEGREIAKKYGVYSYPTFLFLNGDGELVIKNTGYMPVPTFLTFAQEAGAVTGDQKTIKERLAAGENDPAFLSSAVKILYNTDQELSRQAATRYIMSRKPGPYTADEVGFILFATNSKEAATYPILLRDRSEITKIMPPADYQNYLTQITLIHATKAAADFGNNQFDDAKFRNAVQGELNDSELIKNLQLAKLNFYDQTKQYDKLLEVAIDFFAVPENEDQMLMMKAAWTAAEHSKRPAVLQKAAMWAEKVMMKGGESAENSFILATLYAKMGKKAEAKMFAEMSKNLAEAKGADSSAAQALLKSL